MPDRPRPPVPPATRAIRLSWEHQAEKAGLRPVAAWWRWVALERQKPVSWLKSPWKPEA